jgi:hypothetical protein
MGLYPAATSNCPAPSVDGALNAVQGADGAHGKTRWALLPDYPTSCRGPARAAPRSCPSQGRSSPGAKSGRRRRRQANYQAQPMSFTHNPNRVGWPSADGSQRSTPSGSRMAGAHKSADPQRGPIANTAHLPGIGLSEREQHPRLDRRRQRMACDCHIASWINVRPTSTKRGTCTATCKRLPYDP